MSPGVRGRAVAFAAIVGGSGVLVALAGCGGINFGKHDDNLVAGKKLFVQRCGSCHVLGRASTQGVVGPNLDQAFDRAVRDGFPRSTIQGLVRAQIEVPNTRGIQAGPEGRDKPAPRIVMPANLVKGKDAQDVAAYVAFAAARKGKDTGALASAVPAAGAGKPIAAANGKLDIPADPTGQLAYVSKQATAPAGQLIISTTNKSSTPHNIEVTGPGISVPPGPVVAGGKVSTLKPTTFKPGKYVYFCTVPGHRQAGMQGTLIVK